MTRSSFERYGFPILAGVLPLALYVATACRDIFWVDSTEFMLVGKYLAVSHPPGYPLLTLIIRLFSMVPVLALPFRLNLIAGLAAAGSCVMAYFIVVELSRDRLAGLFSALVWGVSFELWQQATALEVYAFQVLLLSVLLLAMVKGHSMEVRSTKDKVRRRLTRGGCCLLSSSSVLRSRTTHRLCCGPRACSFCFGRHQPDPARACSGSACS